VDTPSACVFCITIEIKKLEKYYNEVSSTYEESDYFENGIVHRDLTAVNVIKVMQVIL